MSDKIIYSIIGLIIWSIILVSIVWYKQYKMKKEMGCLTGNYAHVKKTKGVHFNVEYIDNGLVQWRAATNEEIRILKKYKFIS